MDDPMHQYCVSWFSIQVCTVGTKLAVQAWKHHPRSCMWLRYIPYLWQMYFKIPIYNYVLVVEFLLEENQSTK